MSSFASKHCLRPARKVVKDLKVYLSFGGYHLNAKINKKELNFAIYINLKLFQIPGKRAPLENGWGGKGRSLLTDMKACSSV